MTAALFLALFLNRMLFKSAPLVWPLIPIGVALALSRAAFREHERTAIQLLRLVGATSAFIALVRYPLMPISDEAPYAVGAYALLVMAWIAAVFCGAACFRHPALAILPPAYLVWSKSFSIVVTGLPNWMILDIIPLLEVSMALGLGLVIVSVARTASRGRLNPPIEAFAGMLPLLGVAVHLANYFWSAVAKLTLDGPPLAWLQNNPALIFLAALHDGHIAFASNPTAVDAVYRALDGTRTLSGAFVLTAQALAIVGLFLPRLWLLALLLAFDVMHLGILVAAGANFWQWIALNVVIAVVVARHDPTRVPFAHRALASLLILCAPWLVSTAKLGWYDSGVNNRIYLEAIDRAGNAYAVSSNVFGLYSYPVAHMDYGTPARETSLATGTPNGGVQFFSQLQAARRCDLVGIQAKGWGLHALDRRFPKFLIAQHRLAVAMQDAIGGVPANFYPHHFYMAPSYGAAFDALDKREVVAYVIKRESACLSYDGGLKRMVVSTAEHRVDLP